MILEKELKIIVLGYWMEIRGLLRRLKEQDDGILAEIGTLNVAFPAELKDALYPHLGQRIAILRTDIPGREFLTRVFPENDQVVARQLLQRGRENRVVGFRWVVAAAVDPEVAFF